jgi:hypothetical protein
MQGCLLSSAHLGHDHCTEPALSALLASAEKLLGNGEDGVARALKSVDGLLSCEVGKGILSSARPLEYPLAVDVSSGVRVGIVGTGADEACAEVRKL